LLSCNAGAPGQEEEEHVMVPMEAAERLKSQFCPSHPIAVVNENDMVLVVLDDVDALLNSSSSGVLYSLLEWPFKTSSRLIVVAISNQVNLIETKLPHLQTHGTSPIKIVFATYDQEQLASIVQQRCEEVYAATSIPSLSKTTVDDSTKNNEGATNEECTATMIIPCATVETPFFPCFTLDYLCAKISKSSGDLRKVLEIMLKCVDALSEEVDARRVSAAAQTSKQNKSDIMSAPLQVSFSMMQSIVINTIGPTSRQLLLSLPVQQKVLLVIAACISHLQGGHEQVQAFPHFYSRVTAEFNLPVVTAHEFHEMLSALHLHGLIRIDGMERIGVGGSAQKSTAIGRVQVNVTLEGLSTTFQGDDLMTRLLKRAETLYQSNTVALKLN
jgi:cell division control protein 6